MKRPKNRAFVRSDESYNFKRNLFGFVLSGLIGLVGVFQTEFFVSLLPSPSNAAIKDHIEKSEKIQHDQIAKSAKKWGKPQDGIEFKLFGDAQLKRLQEAKAILFDDNALQSELQNEFGASFHDVNAVVIPSWEMNPDNNELIGITTDGWRQATTAKGEVDVGGFTLRDRPFRTLVTLDGRPRLVLNPKAFESPKMLRLTLFHELLHAMNVPGFYPWPFTFAQNDLTYLEEYRAYVKREGLEGWHEASIWVLAVLVPWLITAWLGKLIWNYRKSQRQATDATCAT